MQKDFGKAFVLSYLLESRWQIYQRWLGCLFRMCRILGCFVLCLAACAPPWRSSTVPKAWLVNPIFLLKSSIIAKSLAGMLAKLDYGFAHIASPDPSENRNHYYEHLWIKMNRTFWLRPAESKKLDQLKALEIQKPSPCNKLINPSHLPFSIVFLPLPALLT